MEAKLRDLEEYCKENNAEVMLNWHNAAYYAKITFPLFGKDDIEVMACSLSACLDALLYKIRFHA